jgi:hypothetical protein
MAPSVAMWSDANRLGSPVPSSTRCGLTPSHTPAYAPYAAPPDCIMTRRRPYKFHRITGIMDCCDNCNTPDPHRGNPAYRRVLWAVLAINAAMFLVEIGAGLAAGSHRCKPMPSIF